MDKDEFQGQIGKDELKDYQLSAEEFKKKVNAWLGSRSNKEEQLKIILSEARELLNDLPNNLKKNDLQEIKVIYGQIEEIAKTENVEEEIENIEEKINKIKADIHYLNTKYET
ncbi:MAG: hypothetical protein KAQ92_06405 [Candidatus Aenigmarchaeota archaeon]|nr:hypothetical protein [Candidatus Aenigmarchaeota archaeon]